MRASLRPLACLCMGLRAFAAQGAPADLDRVMTALAQRQHGHVLYVERQYLELLDRPLESSGELLYDAPDRLEKRTLQPRREGMVLEHGTLTIERGRRKHVLDLRQYPQLLPFFESIRATLAGNRPLLERFFKLEFDGNLDHWTLRLTPHDTKLAGLVREICIEGSAAVIRTIETRQADGDRSVMTIGDEVAP
jgi:hypothetical protein